jgi:hypothetical protein
MMIDQAMAMVARTITGATMLGRMCWRVTLRGGQPRARAASMYAFSRTTSTLPRMRRTKVGMSDTPTATMTFVEP